MLRLLYLLVLLFSFFSSQAQQRFINPIEGAYKKDFIISTYPDLDGSPAIIDNQCLTKTYNDNAGTEYAIRSFKIMDSGVNVLAVDSGMVVFVRDGLYDRETEADVPGLGNYIGISHAGKIQTYYGKLKKNSILVKVGDTIKQGQVIAQVGSSGQSLGPHLHFEVWYDSTFYFDPFKGNCNSPDSYWINEIPYDSSFFLWFTGMSNYVPTLDELKEGAIDLDTFYEDDNYITLWGMMHGLRKGDTWGVEWYQPNSIQYSSYFDTADADYWAYYFWPYIPAPFNATEGKWTAKFKLNGKEIHSRDFYYFLERPVVLSEPQADADFQVKNTGQHIVIEGNTDISQANLYDLNGRLVSRLAAKAKVITLDKNLYKNGIYVVEIYTAAEGENTIKILIH